MPKIVVSDKAVGSCTIEYKHMPNDSKNLSLKKEMAIKSLAALQLVCITRTQETEEQFNTIIKILQNAINEIDELYQDPDNYEDEIGYNYN